MNKFKTIVADPPWQLSDSLPGPGRGAVKHYSTMSVEQIGGYLETLALPLADDCRLFLWRLSSLPFEALAVVEAWGFTPKCELVWVKTTKHNKVHFGMGRTLRNCHETCIVASRGRPETLNRSTRSVLVADCVFDAPVGRHSEKPDAFYRLVESLSPGPYVELFARRQQPGWCVYGDEAPDL